LKITKPQIVCISWSVVKSQSLDGHLTAIKEKKSEQQLTNKYKCGHRNVLSKRQVWMSIFHIINFKKKKFLDTGSWILRNARIFFQESNIRLYDKNSESDFFFLHQNQNIFRKSEFIIY
jgi:hypothetical protein